QGELERFVFRSGQREEEVELAVFVARMGVVAAAEDPPRFVLPAFSRSSGAARDELHDFVWGRVEVAADDHLWISMGVVPLEGGDQVRRVIVRFCRDGVPRDEEDTGDRD